MKRIPIKFKTSVNEQVLLVESRVDKLGNSVYCVSYRRDGVDDYVCFNHMSSVIDFISTNFK